MIETSLEYKTHKIDVVRVIAENGETIFKLLIDGKDPKYTYTDTWWHYYTPGKAIDHAKAFIDHENLQCDS